MGPHFWWGFALGIFVRSRVCGFFKKPMYWQPWCLVTYPVGCGIAASYFDWYTRFCLEGLMENVDKMQGHYVATDLDRTADYDVKVFKEEMEHHLRKTMI